MPNPKRLPSGTFRIRYLDPDGVRRSKTFPSRAAANDWYARERTSMVDGNWISPDLGDRTFADWAEEVFVILRPARRRNTRALNRSLYDCYVEPRWGKQLLKTIRKDAILKWVAELSDPTKYQKTRWDAATKTRVRDGGPLSPETVRKIYNTFRTVVVGAVDAELILNPLPDRKKLPLPATRRKKERFLTDAEIAHVASCFRPAYRALVYLCCYGGLRIGEAVALRVTDVDWAGNRVQVSKGQTEVDGVIDYEQPKTEAGNRWVMLADVAVDELRRHVETHVGWADPDAHLFRSPKGSVIRIRDWRKRIWYPAVAKSGIERLTPHDMRHTAAALFIAAGADRWELAAQLGHKDCRMIDRVYGHLFPSNQEALRQRVSQRAKEHGGNVIPIRTPAQGTRAV